MFDLRHLYNEQKIYISLLIATLKYVSINNISTSICACAISIDSTLGWEVQCQQDPRGRLTFSMEKRPGILGVCVRGGVLSIHQI